MKNITNRQSLFLNGAEVARIYREEGKPVYLASMGGCGMCQVTALAMKRELMSMSYVFITTWNTELTQKYIEFVKAFDTMYRMSREVK